MADWRGPVRARARPWLQRGASSLESIYRKVAEIRTGDPLAARFASFGERSRIEAPQTEIINPVSVAVGDDVYIRRYLCIEAYAPPDRVVVRFGNRIQVGYNVRFVAFNGIQVDDMAGIGHGSTVSDSVHRWKEAGDDQAMWDTPPVLGRTLRIGKGVWVGNNCVITGGFDVGDRAIIRPNSVVTFEVPANTIVGGSPACVERRRRPDGGWERLPEPVPLDEYQAKAGRSPRASSTG